MWQSFAWNIKVFLHNIFLQKCSKSFSGSFLVLTVWQDIPTLSGTHREAGNILQERKVQTYLTLSECGTWLESVLCGCLSGLLAAMDPLSPWLAVAISSSSSDCGVLCLAILCLVLQPFFPRPPLPFPLQDIAPLRWYSKCTKWMTTTLWRVETPKSRIYRMHRFWHRSWYRCRPLSFIHVYLFNC